MNTEPTVSVIIPTYNRAHLITRAIRSVLNQTYRDFELIVVDDSSTDNTAEVINGFNDSRIKYIRHDKNKGAAAARNTGIEASRGAYIAFQDSDDEWLPHKLKKQSQAFSDASPNVGVVYSGVWLLEGNRKAHIGYPNKDKKEGDLHYIFLKMGSIYLQSALLKKECFSTAGLFDEAIPAAEDWELWIRISKYYHFKYIEEPLVYIYSTPDSLSAEVNKNITAFQYILMKNHNEFKKDRKLLSDYLLTIGSYSCANGRFIKGKSYLMQSVRANPLNVLALGGMIISFWGEAFYLKAVAIYRKIKGGGPLKKNYDIQKHL